MEKNYKIIWDLILKAKKITILTHIDTDGDTIGSAIALKHLIKDNTKIKDVKISGEPYPSNMKDFEPCDNVTDEFFNSSQVIVVDTSTSSRVFDQRVKTEESIKIDHHHKEGIWLAEIGGDYWPATGQVIYEMAKYLNLKISFEAAKAMLMAIWTDTEGMTQRNPTEATWDAIREVETLSIPLSELSKIIDFTEEEKANIELTFEKVKVSGNIAYFIEDKEVPNNYFRYMVSEFANRFDEEVFMGCAFQNGYYRVGLRSKGNIDISTFAKRFGGGGHFASAGFKNKEKAKVLEYLEILKKELN